MLLVIDSPGDDPDGPRRVAIANTDAAVRAIFLVEAALRILAEGFFVSALPGKKGYIRSGQNKIDFFVGVVCEIAELIARATAAPDQAADLGGALRSLKMLRTLRALRPLRVVSRSESLQVAVGSLGNALPAIGNGVVVCGLIVFIYAIVGISFFKGRFWHCQPKYVSGALIEGAAGSLSLEDLRKVDTKQDCLDQGGAWVNQERNFDSIAGAIPVLCEIITTEGWLEVMYSAVDSRGVDLQPRRDHNPLATLFFVSFLVVGNIFVLNLFVGIVIDKFNRLKDHKNGFALMTKDQRDWIIQEK